MILRPVRDLRMPAYDTPIAMRANVADRERDDRVLAKGGSAEPSPPCPQCGCEPAAVVYETAANVYLVCPQCEHTWHLPRNVSRSKS